MSNQRLSGNETSVRETVREAYSRIAVEQSGCCGPVNSCCGGDSSGQVAKSVGYSDAELATLPQGAEMGLSCGNPTAIAELQPGEVVVDLGSGGGLDVFLAARKVGESGRAIGVDMTPAMIEKARRNQAEFTGRTGLDNVEFRLGEIEHLPVESATVDVVLSNCVINLSPDKQQVWNEVARILRPGARVAVSDIALLQPLPKNVAESVAALTGCIAGAVQVEDTRKMLQHAGFTKIELKGDPSYAESATKFQDPMYQKILEELPEDIKLSELITSLYIRAVRH
ncbi:MAG: arsenite methyltransferase [Candidatus Glassbacteria bacterium]|nr:arsenite methyltransferase [Candidatus Glassbacteria bacterium]